MILPENLTVGLISHIANTNNKQPTPYLSTQEQSLSLQTPQEPSPSLTSENLKTHSNSHIIKLLNIQI